MRIAGFVYNYTCIISGPQLSKLKSIHKRPPSLAANRFYAMAQAVMPKASPEEIYFGVELIVSGLLESIGINNIEIISGISN